MTSYLVLSPLKILQDALCAVIKEKDLVSRFAPLSEAEAILVHAIRHLPEDMR